jgi:hypothetical protein
MRSTTWIAVLPTSPVLLVFLTVLLVLMGFIVAISDAIAYYEILLERFLSVNTQYSEVILGLSEGLSALIH